MSGHDGETVYDETFADLKMLVRHLDPVPERVKAAARASAAWMTIDADLADLAELTYDSVVNEQLVGIRGSGAVRQLTFETPAHTLEIEVAQPATAFGAGGTARRLEGQIVPAQEVDVVIRHRDGVTTVRTDGVGHFEADGVPPGPVSLRWAGATPGEVPTTTDWVVL